LSRGGPEALIIIIIIVIVIVIVIVIIIIIILNLPFRRHLDFALGGCLVAMCEPMREVPKLRFGA